MNSNLVHSFLILGIFAFLFIITDWLLYQKCAIPSKVCRKFLHISSGLLALLLPWFITSHWYVLFICGTAFLPLLVGQLLKKFKSIHAIGRTSIGTLVYPVSVYGCFWVSEFYQSRLLFYFPILILAFADPMAEVVGNKWGKIRIHLGPDHKTIQGTLAFALTAFGILLIGLGYLAYDWPHIFVMAGCIALFTALVEMVSTKGLDNLTIPGAVLLGCYAFQSWLW